VALLASTATLMLLLPVPASAAVEATDAPPGDGITLEVAAANGTGCKPGTVRTSVDPDNNGFRAYFDDLEVTAGGGTEPRAALRSCTFFVKVGGVPAGYQYAFGESELTGYGHVSPGATGLVRTDYYFLGAPGAYRRHKIAGPFDDNWTVRDSDPTAWSLCHDPRPANVGVALQVSRDPGDPEAISFLSMDSSEPSFLAQFRLSWHTC
jgi:hypothetical protein